LVASGHAYRCFATKEETDQQREAYEKEHGKKGFKFQSPWRDRTSGNPTQPHVVRFKTPREGVTAWNDLVKGRIEWPNAEQQDFVLLRSNGLPIYNFGCVVDDHTMGITLVTRGDDHVVNTPIQLLIYGALGVKPPQFAHMPMVLGPDGKKLSKRHAAVSVLDYRDMGYVPDAVLNYLVRLGWSHGDQEIFTRQELIEKFDWEHVGATPAKYDIKKFEYVQAEHLRALPDEALVAQVTPFLKARGIEAVDVPTLQSALPYLRPRAVTLVDLAEAADYFLRDVPIFDEKAKAKFLTPDSATYLRNLARFVAGVETFAATSLHDHASAWIAAQGFTMKHVAQPARVALTGRAQSPGLFEVMEVLGKNRTIERLERGISIAEGHG
jgi:glutamyl-tRNA synthetase